MSPKFYIKFFPPYAPLSFTQQLKLNHRRSDNTCKEN